MAYHRKEDKFIHMRMVAYNGFLEIKPWYKQWYYWWYTHVYFGHNIEKKNTEEQLRISETAFRVILKMQPLVWRLSIPCRWIKLMLAYVIC
jgi:hypothetical protein